MSDIKAGNVVNPPAPQIRRLPAGSSSLCLHDAMNEDGTIILEDLLEPDIVSRINRELDPIMSEPNHGLMDADIVGAGRRLNSSLRYSSTIVNFVAAHPVLIALAESFLLEHCDTLQIAAVHVSDIYPGEPAQSLHRDDYNWGHVKGRTHPLSITTIIALSEFSPITGGTRVAPGSHCWPDAYEASTRRDAWSEGIYAEKSYPPGVNEHHVVQPKLAPGSALSVLGVTVHGAGANISVDVRRRGLVVSYCVGWIRATHANLLLYPPDVAKTFPLPVQRLLGYQLEAKHCGQLEQGVDPITLLEG